MSGHAKLFWTAGCALGLVGVASGAFGAHWLKESFLLGNPDAAHLLEVWQTGSRYALVHALALLASALLLRPGSGEAPPRAARGAGWCFLIGAGIFSISLWLRVLTGVKLWGAVTPLGGVLFLVGWVLLGLAGRARLSA